MQIGTYLNEYFFQPVRISCRNAEAEKEDDGKVQVVAEIAGKNNSFEFHSYTSYNGLQITTTMKESG